MRGISPPSRPSPIEGEGAEFTVLIGEMRLDQFLASQQRELTRSQVQGLIAQGLALVNGRPAKPSQRVRSGDRVSLTIPPPRRLDLVPQPIPLTVVYQDGEIIVIEKPAGLTVHPGPGHPDHTLVNSLLAHCPDIRGVGGVLRPGIVHRLDKDTSGLMVVAKTDDAHRSLSAQIKERRIIKGYLALATGTVKPPVGQVDAPIARDPRHRQRMAVVVGGREARTRYRVLEQLVGYSLLELYLETGRTHQARVHLAFLGHPLLGDAVYGKRPDKSGLGRHFLHAHHLGFHHPATGQPMDFKSGLPEDLAAIIGWLRGKEGAAAGEAN